MKMKKACQATGLTERAIRLYLAKGLLSVPQADGTLQFSQEDIRRLKDIAMLRRFDFTIEQIFQIIHAPKQIAEVLRCRSRDAQLSKVHQAAVSDALANVEMKSFAGINELASALAVQQMRISLPDVMEDEESTAAARRAIEGIEKKNSAFHRLLMVCGGVLIIAVAVCVYLAQMRIAGFVSVGPVYVSEYVNGEITVTLQQEEVIELLGRDRITVRCHAFGAPVQAGETIETGCQLAVELTNQDLLRLGINPLHSMKTRSQAVNDAYKAWALQALFEKDIGKAATLYIREISNLQPLF